MNLATASPAKAANNSTIGNRLMDACRQVAHVSHEARLLKSLAADALDEGAHSAKLAMKSIRRGVEDLADMKVEAVHRLRREPVKAVGAALCIGLVAGLTMSWIGSRMRHSV